jgi:hypothetical protein
VGFRAKYVPESVSHKDKTKSTKNKGALKIATTRNVKYFEIMNMACRKNECLVNNFVCVRDSKQGTKSVSKHKFIFVNKNRTKTSQFDIRGWKSFQPFIRLKTLLLTFTKSLFLCLSTLEVLKR